jgi:hypothetical protein
VRSIDSDGRVAYVWLSSETLKTERQLSRSESPESGSAFAAVKDGLVFRGADGLYHVSADGKGRDLCSEAVCRNADPLPILSHGLERVAFLTLYGAGLSGMDGRMIWSKMIAQGTGLNSMMFQSMTASADGKKLAFKVFRGGWGNQEFDGIHLDNAQLDFVFDSDTGRRVLMVPSKSVNGDVAFALSTDGKILWTFDGRMLRSFSVPE